MMVKLVSDLVDVVFKIVVEKNMFLCKFIGFDVVFKDDFLESCELMLVNSDVYVGLVVFCKFMIDYFYKNVDVDEMFFIYKGIGILWMFMGNICFEYGDYLIIFWGVIYQMEFDMEDNWILYVEFFYFIYILKCYCNWFGQLFEYLFFCECDYKLL